MRVVDSHVHLWDPDTLAYPWLEEFAPLRRPALPAQYAAAWDAVGLRPEGIVHVQADVRPDLALAEVDWVSALDTPVPLRGVVAYAPLEDGAAVTSHLDALRERPLVVGVRRSTQNEPAGAIATPGYREGLRAVARAGLTADLCVRSCQLEEVVDTLRDVLDAEPGLTVVLDHAGKPPVADGEVDAWARHLGELAALPGVVCKLSGLVTEADWASWSEAQVLPYVQRVLATFGPDRVTFASDWPVLTLASELDRWFALVDGALDGLDAAGRDAVLAGTAERAYRLGVPAGAPATAPVPVGASAGA